MIAIVDYGMGNLRSVQKAIERVGGQAAITAEAEALKAARGVILPGVGAFGDAMQNLHDRRLVEPLRRESAAGKPLLGICLGMQLLFEESEEMGHHQGLGLLPGRVVRFASSTPGVTIQAPAGQPCPAVRLAGYQPNQAALGLDLAVQAEQAEQSPLGNEVQDGPPAPLLPCPSAPLRVPHVGWNQLHIRRESPLLAGVPDGGYAYFVHSYYVLPADESIVLATTDYGLEFASVVGRGNLFAAQFHPEKSQEVGLTLLRNFVQMVGGRASESASQRASETARQRVSETARQQTGKTDGR
ncbi:MAG: imidazole glycerol phosphate synthase subunit HisH [Anaerolineae bacterium]|nr:imidazole glycerol phosphate synthase subunit HisH [Anaerolineae bacterium]